jgi:uncharacterized protein (DUF1800 family)
MVRRMHGRTVAAAMLIAGCGGNSGPDSGALSQASSGSNPNVANATPTASPQTLAAGTNPAQLQPAPSPVTPGGGSVAGTGPTQNLPNAPVEQPITEKGAFRLLQQTSFGATEAGIAEAMKKGPRRYLAEQFATPVSRYGYTDRDAIHTTKVKDFCAETTTAGTPARDNCWRDWFSAEPLKFEFFIHASRGTDQLRQRVGFALSQVLVISEVEVSGTYGLSSYFQMLRDKAFGNYRDVLRSVTLHPSMGEYLNMVNNDAKDPNENYARELLQLFSIGTCELNIDGTLKSGNCIPTYDNSKVREYAYALSGWTYPAGGVDPWCNRAVDSWCGWTNPKYLTGPMVGVASAHDKEPRNLLSGVSLPANHSPEVALNAVLDSLMNHPNTAPFISVRLIQSLVKSNPSPAYVQRVASAFNAGKFETFGTGTKGDLEATVAAILLDAEARDDTSATGATAGMLRDPIVMMVNAVRALNGYTDGERMGKFGLGSALGQPVFNSPSVFNFYSPEYRLPGNPNLMAPQFQLSNANTNLAWANYANELVYWWYNKGAGLAPKDGIAGAIGTQINYAVFEKDASNSAALVDRLDRLLTGGTLSPTARAAVVKAMDEYSAKDTWLTDANNASSWQRERFRTAAYLLIASPHYQIQK